MRTYLKHIPYILVGIMTTAMMASAQKEVDRSGSNVEPNPSYDGRYAFARLRYTEHSDDPCTCDVGGDNHPAGWQHDYPDGDRDIMRIATDVTSLNAWTDSSVVLKATDPELMKYPILYLSEPACWHPSESEVNALRMYLLKGGFLIVDDFSICTGGAVRFASSRKAFEETIRRILPDGKLVPVAFTDRILNGFFKLDPEKLTTELQRNGTEDPVVYGIYDHNDPKKRLLVVANYNTVIHRSWVWEAKGLAPVEVGNEAYKLTVNYLLYGFTH